MKNKRVLLLFVLIATFGLTACNKEETLNSSTEQLAVENGISFQVSGQVSAEETDNDTTKIELTAEDLEGMSETTVRLIKDANIYAKPVDTASIIGAAGWNERINVYGKTDDNDWYIVSFNGRVGYVKADCIDKENENVVSPEQPDRRPETSNNSQPTVPSVLDTPSVPDASESEVPNTNEGDVSGDSETPEINESVVPDSNESEVPETNEPVVPDSSESEAPDNTEEEIPDIDEGVTTETNESEAN